MKKLMTAALFATVLTLSAKDLNINGDFKDSKLNDDVPKSWIKNYAQDPAVGKGQIIAGKKDGKFALKVTTGKKNTPFYTSPSYPVNPGDKIEMSADVTGKGQVIFCCYAYGDKSAFKESFLLKMTKSAIPGEIKGVYTVPEKVTYNNVRFVFQVNQDSDVVVSDVEAEIDAAK